MPKTGDPYGRKRMAERQIGRDATISRRTYDTNPTVSGQAYDRAEARAKAVYGTKTGLSGTAKHSESSRMSSKVERARRDYVEAENRARAAKGKPPRK